MAETGADTADAGADAQGQPADASARIRDTESDGRERTAVTTAPARVSTAVVLLVSVAVGAAVIGRVGSVLSAAVALAHAATFGVSLWLVGRERWRAVATAFAGVFALVVGASFAVAVGYTFLDLVASLYPVARVEQIRPRGLRVGSATLAAVGATVAMVGGFATVLDGLGSGRAWRYAKLAVKTFAVPLSAAALMLLTTLLGRLGGVDEAPVVGSAAATTGDAVGALVAPVPGRTHLLTLGLVLATTAIAVARAVEALPVTELTTARTHDRAERIAVAVETAASRVAVVTAAVLPVTLIEVVLKPPVLRGLLTPPVYGLLAGVTGSHLLRALLIATALVAGATAVTVWLLGRAVRTDASDIAVALTPFLGGASVVGLATALHGVVLDPTLAFVADALPGQFATAFTRQSTAVIEFYGPLAVVVTVAAMLVGMTAVLSLALAFVTAVDALPESAPAPALAAVGLFIAAGFGSGGGLGAPLVLCGIVASLLVWDAGEYGTTLGREVGDAVDATAPQAVHVGATLAVGLAGSVAALAVHRLATGATLTDVTTVPFALAVVVAALVLLVAALR